MSKTTTLAKPTLGGKTTSAAALASLKKGMALVSYSLSRLARSTKDDLASWWGTIAYEVFCLLGLNPREYV